MASELGNDAVDIVEELALPHESIVSDVKIFEGLADAAQAKLDRVLEKPLYVLIAAFEALHELPNLRKLCGVEFHGGVRLDIDIGGGVV